MTSKSKLLTDNTVHDSLGIRYVVEDWRATPGKVLVKVRKRLLDEDEWNPGGIYQVASEGKVKLNLGAAEVIVRLLYV